MSETRMLYADWINSLKEGSTVLVDGEQGTIAMEVTRITKTQIQLGKDKFPFQKSTGKRNVSAWRSDTIRPYDPADPRLIETKLRNKQNALVVSINKNLRYLDFKVIADISYIITEAERKVKEPKS